MNNKQPSHKHHVRPDTLDEYIFKEVRGYRGLELDAKDIVLDIGANIGAFVCMALEAGVSRVVAYEPDVDNFKLLQMNTKETGRAAAAKLNRAAVVVGSETTVNFYKNLGKNKGSHSTVPYRGREVVTVPAMPLKGALAERPTKIKIDCEGAEYSLLNGTKLPASVKAIAIEWHLQKREQPEMARVCHEQLLQQGFVPDREAKFFTGLWHYTMIYTKRR